MNKSLDNLGSPNRFQYEWVKYPKIHKNYEMQFKRWIQPLILSDFKDKKILDAGCGTGRNSVWPAIHGAKYIVAFDIAPKTVEVARINLSKFKNVTVEKGSIYNFRSKKIKKFDIVMSIGVIHHLANPIKAIQNLSKNLKKNGTLVIWVYGKEGNEKLLKLLLPIRKVTKFLPMKILLLISFLCTIFLKILLKLNLIKGKYWNLIGQFEFWHIQSIILDQFLPNIANYYSKNEVPNLLPNNKFKDIQLNWTNKNSWTLIAKKK